MTPSLPRSVPGHTLQIGVKKIAPSGAHELTLECGCGVTLDSVLDGILWRGRERVLALADVVYGEHLKKCGVKWDGGDKGDESKKWADLRSAPESGEVNPS